MASRHLVQQENWIDTKVDGQTGEIIEQHELEHRKFKSVPITEDKFVKIYYDTFLALLDYNHSSLSHFLIVLGKYMSYSNDGQVVCLYKGVKEEIAKSLGVSMVRVNQMINDCIKLNLIMRKDRGIYAVSPFVIAKGDWRETKALQIEYNNEFNNMLITSTPSLEDAKKISGETNE